MVVKGMGTLKLGKAGWMLHVGTVLSLQETMTVKESRQYLLSLFLVLS